MRAQGHVRLLTDINGSITDELPNKYILHTMTKFFNHFPRTPPPPSASRLRVPLSPPPPPKKKKKKKKPAPLAL